MLSSGTQRYAFPRQQSEEMGILSTSFSRVRIESTTRRVYSDFVPLRHDRPRSKHKILVIKQDKAEMF